MGTVGAAGIDRLIARAAEWRIPLVDAPVVGTRQPAESGELLVLAAGRAEQRDVASTVFDSVGRVTRWVADEPGVASRLKLVVNDWLLSLLAGLADAVALAEGLGIDPGVFLDVIDGGPVGPAYARIKGDAMRAREYPPNFPVRMAAKDAELVVDAARVAGVDLRLAEPVRATFAAAEAGGRGDLDMAAIVEVLRAGG
jgi:3-hydroxyisobutyrate dehydrogenase